MILFKNVYFTYGNGEYILKNINFAIKKGEYTAVVGENGSGKSTLVKLLLGLLSPTRGYIKREWNRCAYVPQRFESLNSQFPITVYEVLDCYRKVLHIKDKTTIKMCLDNLKIFDLRNHLIGDLSGGQCQKVMIARALLGNPDVLIFDEPSTGIDMPSQMELYPFIHSLNKDKGITIITVEHNLKFAVHYAMKMIHVADGAAHICTSREYVQEFLHHKVGSEPNV